MRAVGAAPVRVSRLSEPVDQRRLMMDEVRIGLTAYRKHLPSKYFYDARGSELFEEITRLPEYYLTSAEIEILKRNSDRLLSLARPDELVELGSGSSRKTLMLIESMHRAGGSRYVPIEISEEALRTSARELCSAYPWLEVDALVGDFLADLGKVRRRGTRVIALLGSTIGNYPPTLRLSLFRSIASSLRLGDQVLLGVDLVKDEAAMVRAYDDSQGVSAEFNLNILRVINRELDGDIPVAAFQHMTRFDTATACMVQTLRAKRSLVAHLRALNLFVSFDDGEELHTEVSCKFTRSGIESEFASSGMRLDSWMTDRRGRYALAVGTAAAL